VDFKKIAQQAKSVVDKRGGTESLKEDFDQLKTIAKGKGSISDKAKEAVEAIKRPGEGSTPPPASPSPDPNTAKGPHPDPAAPQAAAKGEPDGPGKGPETT
jgi:hypothetical protein